MPENNSRSGRNNDHREKRSHRGHLDSFVRNAKRMAGASRTSDNRTHGSRDTSATVPNANNNRDQHPPDRSQDLRRQWINISTSWQDILSRPANLVQKGDQGGKPMCLLFHLKRNLAADSTLNERLMAHNKFSQMHKFAMQGCPYEDPDDPTACCKNRLGEELLHAIPQEDIPACTYQPENNGNQTCTSIWCVLKHTDVSCTTGTLTCTDTIQCETAQAHDIARIQHKYDLAMANGQHTLDMAKAENKLLHEKLSTATTLSEARISAAERDAEKSRKECTRFYHAVFGPSGICHHLPGPKLHEATGSITVPECVENLILSAVEYTQSTAPADLYVNTHMLLPADHFYTLAHKYGHYYPHVEKDTDEYAGEDIQYYSDDVENDTHMNVQHGTSRHDDILPIHNTCMNDMLLELYLSTPHARCFSIRYAYEQCNRLFTEGILDFETLPFALLHIFAPPVELEKAAVLDITTREFTRIPSDFWVPSLTNLGLNANQHPTHAFVLEFYCKIRVSREWLQHLIAPSGGNTQMMMRSSVRIQHNQLAVSVDDNHMTALDGYILPRQSCFTNRDHNTSTFFAPRLDICHCETPFKAWQLADRNRVRVCFSFVEHMLTCEQFSVGGNSNLIEQTYAWLKTRCELIDVLHTYTSPNTGVRPTHMVRRTHAGTHMTFNRIHPMWNHFTGMCSRAASTKSYASDVVCDTAFSGMYCPTLYQHHGFDVFAFVMFDMLIHKLLGPKPGSPYSPLSHMWVIDRTNTHLHYTICNLRWLSNANNAANSKRNRVTQQHISKIRKYKRIRRFKLRKRHLSQILS